MATYRETAYGIQAIVYLGKDGHGKPVRPSKTFKSKKEAELWVSEQLILRSKGISVTDSRMLLRDFMHKWYEDIGSKKSINTSYNTKSRMNHHIIPELGHVPLYKLTPSVVQDFYNKLTEKGLKPSTKKKIMETLSNALRYAIKLQLISYLPTDIEKESVKKNKISYWTFEELTAFLEYTKNNWLYIPVYIMSMTGMRPAELMGLQWKKIDLDNRLIEINAQVINDKESKELVLTDILKTELSERVITIPQALTNALIDHKLRTSFNKRNDFVITKRSGSMSSPDTFRTMFNKYLNKLRKEQKVNLIKDGYPSDEIEDLLIKEMPPYNLRHTHATILLNNGENIKVISERLGHKSVKTTMDTYASVMPKTRTKTADLLDNLFMRKDDDEKHKQ
ncbi:site-specific integrase [Proteiniclasticum sp. SCR006]|uniref:Site-specific integrase n=1 Tax=Proteiniclasticum aestuarii TaxID=2817862 RepID=A0A939H9Z2_9CLOT|nr:site-specific integrase [Proteiniclasticum aestuarii]MBO1264445.1 site-specific integrase [Proteiniclasticum aestuarii]